MNVDTRAGALEKTDWSKEFDWKVIRTLADYMTAYQIIREGVLFREHATESFLCILLDGKVRVMKEDSDGNRKELGRLGRGKVIGEMSLIDGLPRSATLIAAEAATVLIFTPADLRRLTSERPEVANAFLLRLGRDLSLRLRQTSGRLVDYLGVR